LELRTHVADLIATDTAAVALQGVGVLSEGERIGSRKRGTQRVQTARRVGLEPIDDRAHEIWTARPLQTSHLSQRRWIQNFPWQSSDLARRPAGEHGRQLGDTHRLGEVIVHATLEAALSIG